jgi:hypothetical protein
MNIQEDGLEALLRELGMTHCPDCQTPITLATVQVGWDHRPADYPFGPLTWLVCRARVDRGPGQNLCAYRLRGRDIAPGRVVETEADAIAVLRGV